MEEGELEERSEGGEDRGDEGQALCWGLGVPSCSLCATERSEDHKTEVKVDLPNQTVTNLATGKSEHFEINGYKKHCLENGLDDVDFLVQNRDKVEAWEAKNK